MPVRKHFSGQRSRAGRWRVWLLGAACALASSAAWPEIVEIDDFNLFTYSLALRVGSPGTIVDTVSFEVSGDNIGLTPAPITSPDSIFVWVEPLRPRVLDRVSRWVTLSVDSSVAMTCQTSTLCGTTPIPFSKISWTATNNAGSGDIQNDGTFTGGAAQMIARFNANATRGLGDYWTRQLWGTLLTFTYANDVIYPAGTYRGTLRFTATMV